MISLIPLHGKLQRTSGFGMARRMPQQLPDHTARMGSTRRTPERVLDEPVIQSSVLDGGIRRLETSSYIAHVGPLYEAGRDVRDIARAIRTDIKAAVKAKELPKAAYHVNIQRYSGGQSIYVWVRDGALAKNRDEARAVVQKLERLGHRYLKFVDRKGPLDNFMQQTYFIAQVTAS